MLLEVLDKLDHLVLGKHAYETIEDLSALHSDHGGHRGHFELLSNVLMLIHINCYEVDVFASDHVGIRGDFFERG